MLIAEGCRFVLGGDSPGPCATFLRSTPTRQGPVVRFGLLGRFGNRGPLVSVLRERSATGPKDLSRGDSSHLWSAIRAKQGWLGTR